jgi:(S)-2-hydroxy-acid oxidase
MHKLAHLDGEVATSRAAAKNGIAMGLSSWSNSSMEEVAAQGLGNPYAFQVTLLEDRSIALRMLKRAESTTFTYLIHPQLEHF